MAEVNDNDKKGEGIDWAARLRGGSTEQQIPAAARPGDGASELSSDRERDSDKYSKSDRESDVMKTKEGDRVVAPGKDMNTNYQNEGGRAALTGRDSKKQAENNKDSERETQPEKREDGTFRAVKEDKDGNKTVVSSIKEEDAKVTEDKAPPAENLTQRLEGVPGNVDLTQGGFLNSDKSVRDDRDAEEVAEEMEEKSGPNPIPNRDGNELTRAANELSAGGPGLMFNIDKSTTKMADRIRDIRRKGTLTDQDKQDLANMEKDLRNTGKLGTQVRR